MSALVAAELLKMRTIRTGPAFALAFFTLQAAGLVLVLRNAGRLGMPSVGTADHAIALLSSGAGAAILVLAFGVVVFTTEHRHSTLTATLLVEPQRTRVLAAKVAAVALAAGAVAALSVVVALAVGAGAGVLRLAGVNAEVLLTVAGRLLVLPLYGMLGVGLGALIRHQTVAVVLPLLWFLVVETLIPAYGLHALVPWTPGGAAAAVARDANLTGLLPAWAGLLLLAGYAGAALTAGGIRLRRGDVT